MQKISDFSSEDQDYHKRWMRAALEEADKAQDLDEVPIGAVVVYNDQIVGRGHNVRETGQKAVGHAEIMAIEDANRRLGRWRLEGASLYVTLEPCPMCAGAIINARLERVIYGANDPKAGCAGTLMNLLEDTRFNHRVEVVAGVMSAECGEVLSQLFRQLRQRKAKK